MTEEKITRINNITNKIIKIFIIFGLIFSTAYIIFGYKIIRFMFDNKTLSFLERITELNMVFPLGIYYLYTDMLVLRLLCAILLISIFAYITNKFKQLALNPVIFFLIIYVYIHISTYGYNIILSKTITPDSTNYLSCAEHLSQGKGFYSTGYDFKAFFDELNRTGIKKHSSAFIGKLHPYTYPPVYPMLLFMAMRIFNIDSLGAALMINRIFFAVLITFIYLILCKELTKELNLIAFVVAIAMAFFKPFLYVFSFAWTEITFMAISIIAIFLLHKFYYGTANKEFRALVFSSVFASLSFLCRNIGFTTILMGILIIIFKSGKSKPQEKIRKILIFSGISSLIIFPWLIRNIMLTGYAPGAHWAPGSGNFFKELFTTFRVILKDFMLINNRYLKLLVLAGILTFVILKKKLALELLRNLAKKYTVFIGYIILYLLSLNILASKVLLEEIYTRYVVPVYPFIIICLAISAHQFFQRRIYRS